MVKSVIVILSVILSITVKANALQCYVCYNCTKVTDDSLLTCEDYASNSTTSTTTTTTDSTTDFNSTDTNTTSESEAEGLYEIVERSDSFECFSGSVNVGNTSVTVRGCALNPSNSSCEQLGLSNCKRCNTDKCNAASSLFSSVPLSLLLLAVLFKNK